jgi:electron transport complex protein RnfA
METIKELAEIGIGAAIVNNVILSQFLGICPFLGVSKKTNTAAGMSAAVLFVMAIASVVTNIIYYFLLVPSGLTYLNTIVFILVIAALVQFVEMVLKKTMPALYKSLGVYLPLITTNCAVLGTALTSISKYYYAGNFGKTLVFGLIYSVCTALGFAIAIIIMAGIREKIEYNDLLPSVKGMPIVLISAGLMSMAFMGFAGLI